MNESSCGPQKIPRRYNGRQGTVQWIRALRQQAPGQTVTVKHVLADGDMVFVQSHLSATPANEFSGSNRYDFYRVERGLIVEHWVVQAPAPTESANGNSAFSNLYKYAGAQPVLTADQMDLNRLLLQNLSEEVFNKQNFGLLDRFWAASYIQHNPYVATGRAALQSAIHFISNPSNKYRVVRAMADGDLGVVCAHNTPAGGNPKDEFSGSVVCDLYRVANLELVEHWDVGQQVPTSSVNGNSMFGNLYRPQPNR